MVQFNALLSALAVGSSMMGAVLSHPGEPVHEVDMVRRAELMAHSRRSLQGCAAQLKARGFEQRAIERRRAKAEEIRMKRAISSRPGYLKARDAADVLNTSHHSNLTGITIDSDPSLLFTGDVHCLLEPEVTEGPYYVDGELVREDVREGQAGIDLYTDVQVIDINTCEPVSNLWIDFWHSNSTGVYGGIVAGGNGNQADASNINNTFGRGILSTDEDGVIQFTTLFPGHYTGRTPHIHVLTHNGTLLPNNTIARGSVSHVGQLYFDQDLITEVEATFPYISNTQPLTTNAQDGILAQGAENGADPIVEYVFLGDTVSDGIFSWVSIGVDTTASYNVSAAATWTAGGGVANPGSAPGGGPPGGGPPPSGVPSASTA